MRSRTLFVLLPFAFGASALVSPIHRRVVGFPNTHTKPYKARGGVSECQIGEATIQDPVGLLEDIKNGNTVPAQLNDLNTEDILGALTSCIGGTFSGLPGPSTLDCRIGDELVIDPSTLLNSILDGTITSPYGIGTNDAISILQGCIHGGVSGAGQAVPVGGLSGITSLTDTELPGLPTLDSLVSLTPSTSDAPLGTVHDHPSDQLLGGSTEVSASNEWDHPQTTSGESVGCGAHTVPGTHVGTTCIPPSGTRAGADARDSQTSDVTSQVGNATPVKGGWSGLFGGNSPLSGLTGGLPFLSGSGLFGSANLPFLNNDLKHSETNGFATGPLNYEGQDSGTVPSDRGRVAEVSAPEVSPAGASVDSTNAPAIQPEHNEIVHAAAPLADDTLDAVDEKDDSLSPVDDEVADACVSDSEESCLD